jgi:hypothetical protein
MGAVAGESLGVEATDMTTVWSLDIYMEYRADARGSELRPEDSTLKFEFV